MYEFRRGFCTSVLSLPCVLLRNVQHPVEPEIPLRVLHFSASFPPVLQVKIEDVKLGSLDVLPVVKSLLTEQGLYFDNAFVTTPVCCPSRSVVLCVPSLAGVSTNCSLQPSSWSKKPHHYL